MAENWYCARGGDFRERGYPQRSAGRHMKINDYNLNFFQTGKIHFGEPINTIIELSEA